MNPYSSEQESAPLRVDRRQLLRGAAAAVGAVTVGATGPATAANAATAAAAVGQPATKAPALVPGGFPEYRYIGVPFDKATLRYNPTNELIFPCLRGVSDKIPNALGRYYLYYAPHERPGGICLAYGDSLDGRFTEYPNNPIVSNVWAPHYNVSHVSSPHVIWNAVSQRFYLYFHGENTTTRLAWSTDGIHFTYYGRVLHTGVIPGSTETSYARVFEYTVPRLGNRYVMLFMGVTSGTRKIFWGWSNDARTWTYSPTPLIRPGGDGQLDIAAPALLTRNGTTYVVYHGNYGDMFITDVGNNFDRETHLGVFHPALSGGPDFGRCAAPSFGSQDGVQYMFYEAGPRLEGTIAVARAV